MGKYADEGNEKFSEQQENLEKLIKETGPKTKFVDDLDKKIIYLETSGKLLEEKLYVKAETNKKMIQELKEMIKQKNEIQLENTKFKSSLRNPMDENMGDSDHESKLRGVTGEHRR